MIRLHSRKERRLKLDAGTDLVTGQDGAAFAELVQVRNVSNGGAVRTGERSKVQTVEVLDVQQGASRVQFCIEKVSLSGEAGTQALAFEPPILGLGLPKVYELVGTG
jgi:hypothetical protein